MTDIRREPVTGPSVWSGADLADDRSWERRVTAAERADLEAGLAAAKARGQTVLTLHREDFPAGAALRGLAQEVVTAVRDGRGFIVLRGFPIEDHPDDDIRLMYWGFGQHMGVGLSQDATAALVADVKERHVKLPPGERGYGSKRENPLHIDLTDVVGLLGVRQAKGSPHSTLCASAVIYNAVLREHPEWLPRLHEGFQWDRRQEHAPWEPAATPWKVPLFSFAKGQLTVRYNRHWIHNVATRELPDYRPEDAEIFDFIDQVADANRLAFEMNAGDVYFASNHTVFHGRAAYEEEPDWEEGSRRLFMRLWLNIPDFRAFADDHHVRHGIVDHGNLGWTNDELAAGHHLKPGFRRSFGEGVGLSTV